MPQIERTVTAAEVAGQTWDVLVIGTGMGGATLGHRLASAGQRVLFCERGNSLSAAARPVLGEYPELHAGRGGAVLTPEAADLLGHAGRCSDWLGDRSGRQSMQFVPYVGAGAGGSSALYGMALERFFPEDFAPRDNHQDAVDSSLPEHWPVSYDSLAPYYDAAETLYRVRGSADPLRPANRHSRAMLVPPPLTAGGAEMHDFFSARDLHPYRLPMACDFVPGCEGCQGFLCARGCKNDSAKICLTPALQSYGATLLDRCEVLRIDASRTRVKSVVCRRRGETFQIGAKVVVLAAGALQSPKLLLQSTSAEWPAGLANSSGMVGRNLMRHHIDLYLVESESKCEIRYDNRFKELAFNDFYHHDGVKLGSVQSFGRLPPAEMLFGSMHQDLRDGRFAWASPLFPVVRPVLLPTLKRLVGSSIALATTLEDLPYTDNRVYCEATTNMQSDLSISYRIRPEGFERIKRLRNLMRETLTSRRWRRIDQAENNQRIAHVCGTCRFGTDPRSSVVDENNRAHGIDNLYIVDSSFFPSSGGTNPSLTVAANSLRVADHLTGRISTRET